MAKPKRPQQPKRATARPTLPQRSDARPRLSWPWWLGAALLVAVVAGAVLWQPSRPTPGSTAVGLAATQTVAVSSGVATAAPPASDHTVGQPDLAPRAVAQPQAGSTNVPAQSPEVMEINKAVVVTEELDFGPELPSIAQALQQIERRHRPEDGVGRTFAILDAHGGPTPDGKKLRLSMHLSTEKPGWGALVFKPTGKILWQSRIVQGTNTTRFTGQNLLILINDGSERLFTVDGSNNPASILDARIKELGLLVSDFWPNGAEREVTFLYSACGCPVKVRVRRLNDRVERVSDQPVIFPDDPAVVRLIDRLMRW